jgi:hypothetical protein
VTLATTPPPALARDVPPAVDTPRVGADPEPVPFAVQLELTASEAHLLVLVAELGTVTFSADSPAWSFAEQLRRQLAAYATADPSTHVGTDEEQGR